MVLQDAPYLNCNKKQSHEKISVTYCNNPFYDRC